MGKKHNNLSGLSRFVSQAFEQTPLPDSPSTPQTQPRPTKKRKTGLLGPENEPYDATDMVPFFTEASQVPEHLQKYFSQRKRFFSLYDEGCLLDEEGWFSVTPEAIASQIAERCRCNTILDAFCGVGGNAIAFARTCERVIALDTSPTRLALARHNAAIYGVVDRIEFVLADYLSFARSQSSNSSSTRKIDVVFLSPPWGGPSYLSNPDLAEDQSVNDVHPSYSLSSVQPVHGKELFNLSRQITPNVAFYLPRNTVLDDIAALVNVEDTRNESTDKARASEKGQENVEVEEEWMGNKLKALTCYFGGLVEGQERLFE